MVNPKGDPPIPEVAEFRNVRLDGDGVWRAEHDGSGARIEADSWQQLLNRATAVRIRTSINRSAT